MVDALNRTINVGDLILFTHNSYVSPGIVVRVHPRSIRVSTDQGLEFLIRLFDHVIIIEEGRVEQLVTELDGMTRPGHFGDDRRIMRGFKSLLKRKRTDKILSQT